MATRKTNPIPIFLSCFIIFLSNIEPSFSQTDTIEQGQELKHGQQLFSSFGVFRLGFSQLGRANYSYLAIWYNTDSQNNKPVWIANRDDPILGSTGVLRIDPYGSLKISQNLGSSITLYHSAQAETSKVSAVLLDSGNFVLREHDLEGAVKRELWQSFDSPTDTLLPRMKLGFDRRTGLNRTLTSWRSEDFPASGSFALSVGPNGSSQMMNMRWRERVIWTSGVWQGWCFKTLYEFCASYKYNFSYTSNDRETYFSYWVSKEITIFPRITLSSEGELVGFGTNSMLTEVSCIGSSSDSLRFGCVEEELPVCRRSKVKFVSKVGVMSRDGFKFDGNESLSEIDCWDKCFKNCSCVAYASTYENGTAGCEIWTKETSFTENNLATLREIHILESGGKWPWVLVEQYREYDYDFYYLYSRENCIFLLHA